MTDQLDSQDSDPIRYSRTDGQQLETDLWYELVIAARRDGERLATELEALRRTKTFRYTARLRAAYAAVLRSLGVTRDASSARNYHEWVRKYDILTPDDRSSLQSRIRSTDSPVTFSIIMPVYNAPERYLREAIESVLGQIYPHFELCIADDLSTQAHVRGVIEGYAKRDPRIKVAYRCSHGNISAATNSSLDLATGEWVAFLDHDDKIAEHALAVLALEIQQNPTVRMLYSDEDHLDRWGQRADPMFKCDFDYVRLLGSNYICHLLTARRDDVVKVGGMRAGLEGSQDYDLVLRLAEEFGYKSIQHIPRVLYHWRAHEGSTAKSLSVKKYAIEASRRAVADHLARANRPGQAVAIFDGVYHRVRWRIPDPEPSVSILIPTRDGEHLIECLESLLGRTVYGRYEVCVIDNGSRKNEIINYLHELTQGSSFPVRVVRDDRSFNFSALNNMAVPLTTGEVICLLNDDTQVISGQWLEELVSQVAQPNVGAVGAKLYYPDGGVQHGGMILGMGDGAGHVLRGARRGEAGYMGALAVARSVSSVTGACMAVRREAWDSVGGLDEKGFPVSFNDVDFCLRLQDKGWSVVWTPFAELVHVEAASRGLDNDPVNMRRWIAEWARFRERWGDRLSCDPFYSPNLGLDMSDCSLAWPPRVKPLGQGDAGGG